MIGRRAGRLLFTSSIAAEMPSPFEAVYGATKAFVRSFSEAINDELKDSGVTATPMMPGTTETNFFHRAGMDDTHAGTEKKDDPADVARQGFDAMMAGKDHVIVGSLKTHVLADVVSVMPDTKKADMHRGLAEPGTAETTT